MRDRSVTTGIALSGVCLALVVVLNYVAGLHLLGVDAVLSLLAGAFVYLIVLQVGMGGGVLFFAASVLLSLLLVPDKQSLLLYIGVFGIYALILGVLNRRLRDRKILIVVLSTVIVVVLSVVQLLLFSAAFLGGLKIADGMGYAFVVAVLFAVISGIVCEPIYDGFAGVVTDRFLRKGGGSAGRGTSASDGKDEAAQKIVLPKLYDEGEGDFDEDDDNKEDGL
ncbi:MAG: hypothetical protein LBN34_00420 [Clostridiales Family XIII bacterium]|jgi:branched-subunit amino acid transport protein AzlD|nr:hypothetical protein [Clostridiales Family XIII bacterium]